MKRWIAVFLVMAVVAAGALTLDAWRALQARITPAELPTTFVLKEGSSWSALVRDLEQRQWLQAPRDSVYLRLFGRLNDQTTRIQAGEYRLEQPVTARELLAMLVAGRVVQHSVTLIEGWTLAEALAALRAEEHLEHTLPEAREPAMAQLRATLSIEASNPEGWFLPETYHYTRGSTDVQILERAHRAMGAALEAAWAERADDLPLDTPYALLTMASIIEKETGAPEERGRVAGVFTRRLQRGMRLQTDPTVLYGRDPERSGRLRRIDLVTDTPYNTYTRGGLPPTPICLPGRASLQAAANPAEGTALYFVSRNDGTHVFSDTLAEHNRAVNRYQRGGGQ
ncbi:MAG: endolytic transglycosylase MltG [Algiphilus sp.]